MNGFGDLKEIREAEEADVAQDYFKDLKRECIQFHVVNVSCVVDEKMRDILSVTQCSANHLKSDLRNPDQMREKNQVRLTDAKTHICLANHKCSISPLRLRGVGSGRTRQSHFVSREPVSAGASLPPPVVELFINSDL